MEKYLHPNAFTKNLDKVFNDKCLYSKSQVKKRGPVTLCGIYIVILALNALYNIYMNQKLYNQYGLPTQDLIIQNIIDIVGAGLSIVFIYHMCYICRGITGLFIILIFNITVSLTRGIVFKNYGKLVKKLYDEKNKV